MRDIQIRRARPVKEEAVGDERNADLDLSAQQVKAKVNDAAAASDWEDEGGSLKGTNRSK